MQMTRMSFTRNNSKTMNTILIRIEEILCMNNVQVSIQKIPDSNKVEITTIENLPGGTPEHAVVRNRPNCTIKNTYRNGRKTGMQIHTSQVFQYSGDPADHPLKRLSSTSDSPDDTA